MPSKAPSKKASGKASAANKQAKAASVAAPPPKLPPVVPPVVAAPHPGAGSDTSAGATQKIGPGSGAGGRGRSEEHTSELQSLMRISYAVFCLKKKNNSQRS